MPQVQRIRGGPLQASPLSWSCVGRSPEADQVHAGLHIRQGAAAADSALWQMYELCVLGSPNGGAANEKSADECFYMLCPSAECEHRTLPV